MPHDPVPQWSAAEGVYAANDLIKSIKQHGMHLKGLGKQVSEAMSLAQVSQRLANTPLESVFTTQFLGTEEKETAFTLKAFEVWLSGQRKPTETERSMHVYAQQGQKLPGTPWQDVPANEGVDAWAHRLSTHQKLVSPHRVTFDEKAVFIQGLRPGLHEWLVTKHGATLANSTIEQVKELVKQQEVVQQEWPSAREPSSSAVASNVRRQSSGGGLGPEAKQTTSGSISTEELMALAVQRGLTVSKAPQQAGRSNLPWCDYHQANTHNTEDCRMAQNQQSRGPPPGARYQGPPPGMGARPPPGRPPPGRPPPSGHVHAMMVRDDSNMQCWGCGQYGHRQMYCPGPPPQQQWAQQQQQWPPPQQQWPPQQQQGQPQWPEQGRQWPQAHVHPWANKPTGMMMTQGPGPQYHEGQGPHYQQGPGRNMGPGPSNMQGRPQQPPSPQQPQASRPGQAEPVPHMAAHNGCEPSRSSAGARAMVVTAGDMSSSLMHGYAPPISHEDLCAYLQNLENVPGTDGEYVVALARGEKASVRAGPQRTTTALPHSFTQQPGVGAELPTPQRKTFLADAAPGALVRDYAAGGAAEPTLRELAAEIAQILQSELPALTAQRLSVAVGCAVGAHLERSKGLRRAGGTVALSAVQAQATETRPPPGTEGPASATSTGKPASAPMLQSEDKKKKKGHLFQAPNGVPFVGEPAKAWFDKGENMQAYLTASPGLAFVENASPTTGVSVTHPRGNSEVRPGQRVVCDSGANLMVATYREAAEGRWPVVEDPGSFFPLGPLSQVRHRVAGGVDVTYAAGTPFERTVKGVTCFLVPNISNTGAGVLLASTATQPVGAAVDPVMRSLRFRPFYGVEGSTDSTFCNLPVVYECEQQRPTVCMVMQA